MTLMSISFVMNTDLAKHSDAISAGAAKTECGAF